MVQFLFMLGAPIPCLFVPVLCACLSGTSEARRVSGWNVRLQEDDRMKLVSKASLGAALALGMIATGVSTPAFAKKENKEKAQPQYTPQLSKEFRAAISAAQTAAKAANAADASAKLAAAEAIATQPDEKFYVGAIAYDIYKLTKDQAAGRKAINQMIASNSKMASNLVELYFVSGNMAYEAGDFPDAIAKLTEADRLGSKSVDRLLRLAEAHFKLNQQAVGLTFVERAVAEASAGGQKAPESWYARAASVAYKAKLNADVAKWTSAQVRAYPTPENWRSALVTYRDGARLEGQPSLDLFRLMRLTKSLAGERDFFEYASLAIDRALPGEAKSTIEEGFASGVVNKSSRAVSEVLTLATSKIPADRASIATSEKLANAAGATGKPAAGAGDAYLGYGEDAKAITFYKLALEKGGVDMDQVNTRLGIALARSGQKDEAKKYFSAVRGPRADIAKYWLLYLDLQP